MDWDKLRIFHAVAEAGSFTHAGDTLNLSQSAVSRQISTLEESLGVSLFHRHARGLILTEQGELLFKAARDIFGKLAMLEGKLLDSRQRPEGPLRITAAEFLGATWLAPLLREFQDQNPDIQLTLLLDDRIFNLNMREADAAIRLYKPDQGELIQRQMATLRFCICASEEYLARHGVPQSVADLQSHVLIGYPDSVTAPYADPNWLFHTAGVDPDDSKRVVMMNSIYGIFQAVRSGAGIAVLPRYLVRRDPALREILPDVSRPDVEMYFVYPEERKHSKRIAVFRDFLLQYIAELEA